MTPDFAGICIAAGASTRMGWPKALLECGGDTAADHALRNLRAGGCERTVLVLGAEAERIRAGIQAPHPDRTNICVVENPHWAEGRTGSIQTGIRALHGARAYVLLPVDHLLVNFGDVAVLVQALRDAEGPRRRSPHVILPEFTVLAIEGLTKEPTRKTGHPILFDADTVAADILAAGPDTPLRDILRAHRDDTITVPAGPGVIMNIDTPEQLEGSSWGTPD